jgi:amidophosphoribosyltransferase
LVLGAINENSYVVASESVALDAVGAQYVRDILPGESFIQMKMSLENFILI